MPLRFLVETLAQPQRQISVAAERAHYLCKVMRKQAGDVVDCFDGQGTSFTAEILTAKSRRCDLRIVTVSPTQQEPLPSLHIGIAILKGQAMDRALQQATELGARSIHLLRSARGNVHLSPDRLENKLAHWRRIMAGACEQSGHLHLPKLHAPLSIQELIENNSTNIVVLDMAGVPLPSTLQPTTHLMLIGPEGGWDDSERSLFAQHCLPTFRISNATLRAETVPTVALALMEHICRE